MPVADEGEVKDLTPSPQRRRAADAATPQPAPASSGCAAALRVCASCDVADFSAMMPPQSAPFCFALRAPAPLPECHAAALSALWRAAAAHAFRHLRCVSRRYGSLFVLLRADEAFLPSSRSRCAAVYEVKRRTQSARRSPPVVARLRPPARRVHQQNIEVFRRRALSARAAAAQIRVRESIRAMFTACGHAGGRCLRPAEDTRQKPQRRQPGCRHTTLQAAAQRRQAYAGVRRYVRQLAPLFTAASAAHTREGAAQRVSMFISRAARL